MTHVKIFTTLSYPSLEDEINKFILSINNIEIVDIKFQVYNGYNGNNYAAMLIYKSPQ